MILATAFVIFVLLVRWQIVHIHGTYRERPWFDQYKNGDTLWYRGCRATVIDRKTVDMVIRRHLVGLLPWVSRRSGP